MRGGGRNSSLSHSLSMDVSSVRFFLHKFIVITQGYRMLQINVSIWKWQWEIIMECISKKKKAHLNEFLRKNDTFRDFAHTYLMFTASASVFHCDKNSFEKLTFFNYQSSSNISHLFFSRPKRPLMWPRPLRRTVQSCHRYSYSNYFNHS